MIVRPVFVQSFSSIPIRLELDENRLDQNELGRKIGLPKVILGSPFPCRLNREKKKNFCMYAVKKIMRFSDSGRLSYFREPCILTIMRAPNTKQKDLY